MQRFRLLIKLSSKLRLLGVFAVIATFLLIDWFEPIRLIFLKREIGTVLSKGTSYEIARVQLERLGLSCRAKGNKAAVFLVRTPLTLRFYEGIVSITNSQLLDDGKQLLPKTTLWVDLTSSGSIVADHSYWN